MSGMDQSLSSSRQILHHPGAKPDVGHTQQILLRLWQDLDLHNTKTGLAKLKVCSKKHSQGWASD